VKLVTNTEQLKMEHDVRYPLILGPLNVCSSTYRRWRARIDRAQDPVQKRGPKPLNPLDFQELHEELSSLVHGKKRSRGVGRVRACLKDSISRRELSEMIALNRDRHLREERAAQYRLRWHVPGTVWSMDIFEIALPLFPRKYFVHSVTDLASGYKLPPMLTEKEPLGVEVSTHLQRLFEQFGCPLFLKRDNGGNLNHRSVNHLLSRYHVLPLNSPCYYAPYNGAIEHAQGEIKWQLKKVCGDMASVGEFARSVALVVHDLNHITRRGLGGDTSCQRFFADPKIKYHKRKREEVFVWISERALAIVNEAAEKITPAAAWRIACRMWLVKNGLLSISKSEKVLPYFSEKTAHN